MEAIAVEKHILALEKKNVVDERKYKKVTFRDDCKKKQSKDPFDLEGLQKVLKTMSNEMVDIKKQVVKTSSKNPYKPYRKIPSIDSNPPNAITNAEFGGEAEEVSNEEPTNEDEVVEVERM